MGCPGRKGNGYCSTSIDSSANAMSVGLDLATDWCRLSHTLLEPWLAGSADALRFLITGFKLDWLRNTNKLTFSMKGGLLLKDGMEKTSQSLALDNWSPAHSLFLWICVKYWAATSTLGLVSFWPSYVKNEVGGNRHYTFRDKRKNKAQAGVQMHITQLYTLLNARNLPSMKVHSKIWQFYKKSILFPGVFS